MDIRVNHRDMSDTQKQTFINAILVLKNEVPSVLRPGQQYRYDDFVQIHKNSMGRGNPIFPNPHRTPLFYPWHRILIRQFELELKAAANDRTMTLPYWNWSRNGSDDPFTDDFMGRDGDPLQNHVTSGPFAFERRLFGLKIWDTDEGDVGLRRNFGANADGRLPSMPDVEDLLDRTPYWAVGTGWENLSEDLHNGVHSWIGGNMASASSPNDPVFFLHHCRLDFLWEQWKQRHPLESPISFPDNAPHGIRGSRLIFHPDIEPAPWSQTWTIEQTLDTQALGYTYG